MNNKGQESIVMVIFAFMLMVIIIVLALGLAFPIRQGSDVAMNTTNMDCTNSSIPDSTRAACYIADISPFFFIGGLVAIAGIILAAKIYLT
jgi:hypothetical protein